MMGALEQVVWGVLLSWLACLFELLVVLVLNGGVLTSVWEVQFALLYFAPLLLAITGLFAVFLTPIARLLPHADRTGARVALSFVGALFGGLTAFAVGGGRHLASPPTRLAFTASVALLSALCLAASLPWLARSIRQRPRTVVMGSLLLLLTSELANRWVLVRLYPAFHLALALLTMACVVSIAVVLPLPMIGGARARRRVIVSVLASLIGLAAASPLGFEKLRGFDNFRLLVASQAPVAGEVLRRATELFPAPFEFKQGGELPDSRPGASTARGLELADRDIFLITIDALRADHVGAYGYPRRTTPELDRLAREGVRFEYAYAPTPHTSYSVVSLMTGKYMRPLLLQGAGVDSETWPFLLRRYGYKTAGFYPPAVFFIDTERFTPFIQSKLGFEYEKVEFAEGAARVAQVRDYLERLSPKERVFLWVHSFLPHEPYQTHPEFDFGERDVDRYDSEIAMADHMVAELVRLFRKRSPTGLLIVTADHGEEFGEHGGRYHGTTVYEEQVRVPLIFHAPEQLAPRVVPEPVQTIDLLPTILAGLEVPRPPRIRGRDLGPVARGTVQAGEGFAAMETDEQLGLALGKERLICQRKLGACRLFDLHSDPGQKFDLTAERRERAETMRRLAQHLTTSHGLYETEGLRKEGKAWPPAIIRGISGDVDAAAEIAQLLDDADPQIRRKAAELLFELRQQTTVGSLVLALGREEDSEARTWLALALVRLGRGAPLVYDVFQSPDLNFRRLAALALAENGDRRGVTTLIEWWKERERCPHERSRQLLIVFAQLREKDAVVPLLATLTDVRLRPLIAQTLAQIGDRAALVPLTRALGEERYQSSRVALADALVRLGAEAELAGPLVRFLGVPDPIPNGLDLALKSKILEHIGGPSRRELQRLAREAHNGVKLTVQVPKTAYDTEGLRVIVRVHTEDLQPGEVRVARPPGLVQTSSGSKSTLVKQDIGNKDEVDAERAVVLVVPSGPEPVELAARLPQGFGVLRGGRALELSILATTNVRLQALAVVPLTEEIPPPPPKPWQPPVTDSNR